MVPASSASNRKLSARDYAWIIGAAVAGICSYLAAAAWSYRLGFPLDDSWIHATYARNLALNQQWAFRLGQPSTGSTAPLWTVLLVPGYWLGLAPLWWSYVLGFAALAGLGLLAEASARRLAANYRPRLPWVGVFFASEWHMVWAASSGMETLLHAVLVTAVLAMLITGSRRHAALGLLTGLSVWIRPDGLTLVGPVLVALFMSNSARTERHRAMLAFCLGFGAPLLLYVAFNLSLSGRPMPNTFYAKQAEYAAWQARPFLYRAGIGLAQLSTGPLILLWPGLAITVARAAKTRDVATASALAWCVLYMFVYVLRLPAYQHGRYLMPAMPMLLLLGILGYVEFQGSQLFGRNHWAVNWAWQSALVLLSAAFLALGARAYGQDVGLIETEMVNTAEWVANSLPSDAVIAAHDIGALGYFDRHRLIDLAGLASPEVLPFIRNQARLASYLDERDAQYLITFPDLYPQLVIFAKPVHESGGPFAPAAGQGNMTVYCWRCR